MTVEYGILMFVLSMLVIFVASMIILFVININEKKTHRGKQR